MSTKIYFDREEALAYLMEYHSDENREAAEALLNEDGYCRCCGVDYTGLDRDMISSATSGDALEPHPWQPGIDGDDAEYAAGRVDFQNTTDDRTVVQVRVTDVGAGVYKIHIDQLSDADQIVITHDVENQEVD